MKNYIGPDNSQDHLLNASAADGLNTLVVLDAADKFLFF